MNLVCLKARTGPYTLESLGTKAETYRRNQADLERARKAAEEAGSPGASSGSSPAAAGAQLGGATAAGGPLLNPSAMACSRTVYTGEFGGRGPKTPGAKPRGAKSTMSGYKQQTEVQELVERRMASLDVSKCWSGIAMGRELRWARESHQTIVDGSPSSEDLESADALRDHVEVCEAICGLVEKPIMNAPKAKLDAFLGAIEKFGEDMPSRWKSDVLKMKVPRPTLGAGHR